MVGYLRRARRWGLPDDYPRGHFYSPLPDLDEVRSRAGLLFDKDTDVGPSIDLRSDEQLAFLRELATATYADFNWPVEPAPSHRFHLHQGYFGRGSAFVLAGVLRRFRPRRVIEVGSGYSSAVMLDVDERYHDSSTSFTFIDPYPDRLRSLMRPPDLDRVEIISAAVQDVPYARFEALADGDMLFIDSSHVSRAGSDVNHLLFRVLPRLSAGVVVHFHDVYWPFQYPLEWIERGRAWNEAYLLRAFLQYNERFEILLYNNFLAHRFREFCQREIPLFASDPGSSIWLRKR